MSSRGVFASEGMVMDPFTTSPTTCRQMWLDIGIPWSISRGLSLGSLYFVLRCLMSPSRVKIFSSRVRMCFLSAAFSTLKEFSRTLIRETKDAAVSLGQREQVELGT